MNAFSESQVVSFGEYIRDSDPKLNESFYDSDVGLTFSGVKDYMKGDFFEYSWVADEVSSSGADVLREGDYENVQQTLNRSSMPLLENPMHSMNETLTVDSSKIRYYLDGLGSDSSEALKMAVDEGAFNYTVMTGCIPKENFGSGAATIDLKYKGKIIIFGEEYFVENLEASKIYLAKGRFLEDITNDSGYLWEYLGYRFKVSGLTLVNGTVTVIGLDVKKPSGSVTQVSVSRLQNGIVDDLEILGVVGNRFGGVDTASILVYDTSTEVILEDGEDLQVDGITYEGSRVKFMDWVESCDVGSCCGIAEYAGEPYEVITQIKIEFMDDLDGVNALEVSESVAFLKKFILKFNGFTDENFRSSTCSAGDEQDIVIERGSNVYQMDLSFTADDGNRYDDVRMDEGPYAKGETFVMSGGVWEYNKYKLTTRVLDVDDTVNVTLKPLINGSSIWIDTNRFCDPDDNAGAADTSPGGVVGNCTTIGTVTFRKIALVDAMRDSDPTVFEEDDTVEVDSSDLFWADSGIAGADVIYFIRSTNTIVFAQNENDRYLTIEPDMVGTVAKFEMDNISMRLMRECDFANDVNATTIPNNVTLCDWNNDNVPPGFPGNIGANDDDLLVLFTSDGEATDIGVIDLTDRGYNEGNSYRYKNSVKLYSNFTENVSENAANLMGEIDEDVQSMLVTPSNRQYTVDWGVDNMIDSVYVSRFFGSALVGRSLQDRNLALELSTDDGVYDGWLSEGPYSLGYMLVLDGKMVEFEDYSKADGAFARDDTVTVQLLAPLNGINRNVELNRLCDPEGMGASTFADCTVGGTPTCNCTGLPASLDFRVIALTDAMDDSDPTQYENDAIGSIDPEDLFWAEDTATAKDLIIWFDESTNTMFYATDEDDRLITIEPDMVNPGASLTNDTYKMVGFNTKIWVMREGDFANDINASVGYNETLDLNGDSRGSMVVGENDDDLLVIFESERDGGYAVADFSDRGYNEVNDWSFKNSLGLYSNFTDNATENDANRIVLLDEDVDTILYTPIGDKFTLDWGVDNKLDSITLCSPAEEVKATYFVGLSVEETNISEMSSDVDATANQTTTLDFGDVTMDIITGDDVSSDMNVTLYLNATDFFADVWGITMLPSSLGRYVKVEAGEPLEGNLTSFMIRVYYSDSEVAAAHLTESRLRLYRYNETTDMWVLLTPELDWVFGSGVNTVSNYVWANTSRLSTYGIWEGTTTTTTTVAVTTTTRYRGGGGGGSGGGGGTSGAKPLIGCFDGIKNCHGTGCETGVDCGGPCASCMSCSDGIQNQGEIGIDCGGPCEACKVTTTTKAASSATTTQRKAGQTTTTVTEAASTITIAEAQVTTTTLPQATAIPSYYIIIGSIIVVLVLVFAAAKNVGALGFSKKPRRRQIISRRPPWE